jgi:hypothetical protein
MSRANVTGRAVGSHRQQIEPIWGSEPLLVERNQLSMIRAKTEAI